MKKHWYLFGSLGFLIGELLLGLVDWRISIGTFLMILWVTVYLQGDRDDIEEIKKKIIL